MKRKKIAYITGTRADFGLMTSLLHAIDNSSKLELSLYATGMHLMPQFGNTIQEVRKEFKNVKRIDAVFQTNSRESTVFFASDLLKQLTQLFIRDLPDFALILGDRVEMITVALACLYFGIPVGHVHGGERTGTVDEIARHAITKLSHLHFVATKDAYRRVIKLGEEPWRVHIVGAPSLDAIFKSQISSSEKVHSLLGLGQQEKILLVTLHPISEDIKNSNKQMEEVIKAVKTFNLPTVVIYPNSDPGSKEMIAVIEKEKNNPLFRTFPHIEYATFLGLQKIAAVWIGNSSAGIIESPSSNIPVVNVGPRQRGRLRAENISDVGYNQKEIEGAIRQALDFSDRKELIHSKNPWGDGKAGERIIQILEKLPLNKKLLEKQIAY